MLLAIDIGNTSITLGFYKGDELLFVSKMLTDKSKCSMEYSENLLGILGRNKISAKDFDTCVLSSVVPCLTDIIANAVHKLMGIMPILVGEENHGNFKTDILPISQIGSDLIAGSVGANAKYQLPCLVADLGTATKILVIDGDGKFRGCTIAPGIKISLDALSNGTALLPEISLSKPQSCVGTNTVECMQSGIVFGTAAMLDGMFRRISEEMSFKNPTLIITGGYSKGIAECCESDVIYDENLLLHGLKVISENAKKN